MFDAAADFDAAREPERAIARYLAEERRAAARRLLRIGVAALLFGALGVVPLYQWFVDGGVIPEIAFAAPFLLVIGALLTAWALAARARAALPEIE